MSCRGDVSEESAHCRRRRRRRRRRRHRHRQTVSRIMGRRPPRNDPNWRRRRERRDRADSARATGGPGGGGPELASDWTAGRDRASRSTTPPSPVREKRGVVVVIPSTGRARDDTRPCLHIYFYYSFPFFPSVVFPPSAAAAAAATRNIYLYLEYYKQRVCAYFVDTGGKKRTRNDGEPCFIRATFDIVMDRDCRACGEPLSRTAYAFRCVESS